MFLLLLSGTSSGYYWTKKMRIFHNKFQTKSKAMGGKLKNNSE